MERVSTRLTVFLKFFFPTIWIVFFGTLTLIILVSDNIVISGYSQSMFRLLVLAFFLTGTGFLYYAFMSLKRVDMDNQYMYVTNYLKAFKYPFHNVASIREKDFILFKAVTVIFREEGSFGKRITFLTSPNFYKFLAANPGVARSLGLLPDYSHDEEDEEDED